MNRRSGGFCSARDPFSPGYSLIAALFCKEDDIDFIERIALSFGLSIAVVSLIGLCLNFTPWGIRLDPLLISLTLFTVTIILITDPGERFLCLDNKFRFPFSEIPSRQKFF